MGGIRRVLALISPRLQRRGAGSPVQRALERHWGGPRVRLTCLPSLNAADGQEKARRAMDEGVDTILVVGGDGMVNSIGSVLIGSSVALGVVPAGSGNGFARHFDIPLNPVRATEVLRSGKRRAIDVGTVNGIPFFVTCGMAWDAALVRSFEKFPMRGVLPYVLAAASEYFTYRPQLIEAILDGRRRVTFSRPVIFTVANLTQYGGGALIAPSACPDDGLLELVAILRQDLPRVVGSLNRLFDGTLDQLPGVDTRRFFTMTVRRRAPAPIQMENTGPRMRR